MRVSLEKLVSFREGYKVQGKRYDWPISDDLREFETAQADLVQRIAAKDKVLMLDPKTPTGAAVDINKAIAPPVSESAAGVGTY